MGYMLINQKYDLKKNIKNNLPVLKVEFNILKKTVTKTLIVKLRPMNSMFIKDWKSCKGWALNNKLFKGSHILSRSEKV